MIFDIEADGLEDATVIHCLSYIPLEGGEPVSIIDYDEMIYWLTSQSLLVGHNITTYDVPLVERLLGIKIEAQIIDTLALSWYLWEKRQRHGLEWWGEDFGIKKPPVVDWKNEPVEVYVHRCEEDVKINQKLWLEARDYIVDLYEVAPSDVPKTKIIKYLGFKMKSARLAEKSGWYLDKDRCYEALAAMEPVRNEKVEALKQVMPKVPVYGKMDRPKKPFKKDGTVSAVGEKWNDLCDKEGISRESEFVKFTKGWAEPNPGASQQVKDWLFSLGWEPETFKEVKEDDGSVREIPQIKKLNEPELCESVSRLAEEVPEVAIYEGLSIVSHRISIINGFLDNVREDGKLKARVQGFTNTMRFKHTELVNLPGLDKAYGEWPRSCLVAPEGHVLCGADMVSLESTTKRHYMYPLDPDYVEEMSQPGFDEHLNLALREGYCSQEDYDKWVYNSLNGLDDEQDPEVKKVRKQFKPVNYSGIYKIGKIKLAKTMKTTVSKAEALLNAYWRRNWSVKVIASGQKVKVVNGQMWLFNPVSELWMSLRYEKDIFSTLNQSTGVFCFDTWLACVLAERPQITGQFHDEGVWCIPEGREDDMRALLERAIDKTNRMLNLNVPLAIDVKFGRRYDQVH